MEFDTEFIQFTRLEPSIYRLKETLNLLKIGLWLRTVWTEVTLVRTVFCDRLSETTQFWRPSGRYSLSVRKVGRLDVSIGRPDIQVVRFFLSFPKTPILSQSDTQAESYDKNTDTCVEIFLETWKVSRSVSEHEIQLQVEIEEAWPSVWTMLPFCPDVFNAEGSRHCGASGRLQRPIRTVEQELAVLTWKLHGIFMDIFLETCEIWHEMRHCPYYLKTLSRTDKPVKRQPLHIVFLSTRMLPI
jgi:hypothetical protein